MKQHITKEQLKELEREDDYSPEGRPYETVVRTSRRFRLLSELVGKSTFMMKPQDINIGKMMEILDESIHTYDIKRSKKANNWIVIEYVENDDKNDIYLTNRQLLWREDSSCLCDALWECVKQVIK